jgi:hypothetical protein
MLSEREESWASGEHQKRAPRQMTVLITAAIEQDGRDGLCRIRNMSPTGLSIETALPIIDGQPATIMLHSARTLTGIPRWAHDGRVGLSCDVDPTTELFGQVHNAQPGAGPTLPRFSRAMGIEIVSRGFFYGCTLDSISTKDVIFSGAPATLGPLQNITVSIRFLGNFIATVRINDDGHVYATFATPIGFAELNPWLVAGRWERRQIRRPV